MCDFEAIIIGAFILAVAVATCVGVVAIPTAMIYHHVHHVQAVAQ